MMHGVYKKMIPKALNGPDWSRLKSNLGPDQKIASIRSGLGYIKMIICDWTRPDRLFWSGPVQSFNIDRKLRKIRANFS
jgi:hypothetical protein